MKKVLALTLGTGLATAAMPSFALEDYVNNVGVSVTGIYSKPSNNALSIGEMQTQFPPPTVYPFSRALFLKPEFNWNYGAGITYHFTDTCTRFFVEYNHFNNHDQRTASGVANVLAAPFANVGSTSNFIQENTVNMNVRQTANEWRLGFKHFIPFGNCFSTQLSAYFEYNKVSQSLYGWNYFVQTQNNIGEGVQSISQNLFQEYTNSFKGWGPGIGLSFRGIPFGQCLPHFGLFASINTSLFYADNYYKAQLSLPTFSQPRTASIDNSDSYLVDPESSKSLVGKYDINIGVDYVRELRLNYCPIQFGLTLGVRYMNIVNAFKNGNLVGQSLAANSNNDLLAVSNPGNFPIFGVPADWGYLGPYLRFSIGGANA